MLPAVRFFAGNRRLNERETFVQSAPHSRTSAVWLALGEDVLADAEDESKQRDPRLLSRRLWEKDGDF
jgi:hypothetical protein